MKFTPKKSVLLLFTIIFLLLAVQVVSAQSGNIFDSFKNIFGSDFGELYKNNWWVVDLIVYLFFFGYIGKLALGSQFQGKGGTIGIVFGVALAIALVAFEAKTGFQLGNLGPYAMAVLVLALAFITWKFFHGLGMGNGGAAAVAVVVIYGTLATVASPLLKALRDSDNSTIQMFASIIDLLLLIAVIAVAWNGFSFVFRMFKGGSGGGIGGLKEAFTSKKEEQKEEAGEQREEAEDTVEQKEEKRIQALVTRVDAIERRNYQDVDRMVKDVDELIRLLESGRRDPQVVEAIGYKLKDISSSEADIKNITVALKNTLAELDATEKAEVRLAVDALSNARKITNSELKTDLGRNINATERRKLTTIQSKIQTYIENLAMQQWTGTRKELDSHITVIASLETQLPNLFTQAVDYLKVPGRLRSAIASLQSARGLLVKIKAAIQSLEKMDIPKLKGRINTTMKELQIERNLADRLKEDFKKP